MSIMKSLFDRKAAEVPFDPGNGVPRSTTQEAIDFIQGGGPGPGTGAPEDAQYLVSSGNGDLTNERVVSNGLGISWDFSGIGTGVANLDFFGLQDLTDPGADRGLHWSASDGAFKFFEATVGLGFSAGTLSVTDPDLVAIINASFAQGDILYHDGTTLQRLPRGVDGQFLRTRGASNLAPDWQNIAGGGDMLRANNLSDLSNFATARSNLGVGTEDSPTFTDLTLSDDLSVAGDSIFNDGRLYLGAGGSDQFIQKSGDDVVIGGDSAGRWSFYNGGTHVVTVDGASGNFETLGDVAAVDANLSGYLNVDGGAGITGGALPTQFSGKGVYIGTETNGNEQFNIISTGTYGYFDIGGINEDYKMRFLVAIATGNTVLDAAGTLAFTTGGAVSFNQAVSVPADAFDSGWNGDNSVPTKNDIWDGLVANYQPLSANLTEWSGINPSANGGSLVAAADYAAMRALLDLESGTDFLSPGAIAAAYQPLDASLTAYAALTTAADKGIYFSAADTPVAFDFVANGRSLVGANYAGMRALLDLEVGTDFNAYSARLADIAGISWTQGDLLYFNGTNLVRLAPGSSGQLLQTNGAGANPSWETAAGSGTVTSVDVAISGTGISVSGGPVTSTGTITLTIGANLSEWAGLNPSANAGSLVTAADYAAMRALLDLEAGTDFLSPAAIAAAYQPLDELLTEIAALSTAPGADRGLFYDHSGTAVDYFTATNGLEFSTTNLQMTSAQRTKSIFYVIDGGGATITTGIKGDLSIPFACTVQSWTLLADQSGAIVIDVWKDTYGNFPPVNADSMVNGNEPTITASGVKAQSSSLGGWTTTSIAAGDTLRFNVDSVTSIRRVTLELVVLAT